MVDKLINWDMILCRDNEGNIHTFLTSWTDYPTTEPENPFMGSVDFRFQDLQMLQRLLCDIKKV